MLQVSVSSDEPRQLPVTGLQLLILVLIPPPQLAEQLLQGCQAAQVGHSCPESQGSCLALGPGHPTDPGFRHSLSLHLEPEAQVTEHADHWAQVDQVGHGIPGSQSSLWK